MLHQIGRTARVVAPLGGSTGARLRREADRRGIDGAWVDVAGETRRTVVAWDTVNGVATTLSEPGPLLTGAEWDDIASAVRRLMPAAALVISGSAARGLPGDAIAQLIAIGRSSGTPMLVDTSSPALLEAIDGGAAIKPNRDELAAIVGHHVGTSSADLVAAATELRAGRDVAVVASDGPRGLVAVTPSGSWLAQPPLIEGANATGAGDACVAGIVAGLADGAADGAGWASVVRLAAALGADAARRPVAGEVGDHDDLYAATHVEEL